MSVKDAFEYDKQVDCCRTITTSKTTVSILV